MPQALLPLRRPGASARLLLFIVPIGLAGFAIWIKYLALLDVLGIRTSMPLLLYFALCVAATAMLLEVHVHRTPVTFSLTEVPIVIGLLLVPPWAMLICYLSGVLVAHWLRRGIRADKDIANLFLDTFYLAITVVVFRAAAPLPQDPFGGQTLFAVAAAMGAASVIGPILLNVGIWLYEWEVDLRATGKAILFQVMTTVVNSCLGIMGMVFTLDHPWLTLVLLPPMALVFAGQVASTKQQQQASRMQYMHDMSELLHSTGNLISNATGLVDRMVAQFGAGQAELIILTDRSRALHVYSEAVDGERTATLDLTLREHDLFEYLLGSGQAVVGSGPEAPGELVRFLRDHNQELGVVVLLKGSAGSPLGAILLTFPPRIRRRLPESELALLGSVAGQIAVALEKGQLADEVRAMSIEKQQLNHRLFHDPLTRLANRSLFNDRVGHALTRAKRVGDPVAVMFIDLDDFKFINDTHGHSVGDELLQSVGERLRLCIRAADTAARFGGDEFGLLLEHVKTTDDVIVVAERLVASLAQPHRLSGVTVTARASVGVSIITQGTVTENAAQVLGWADTAMYAAKRRGKGSYAIFEPGMDDSVSERLAFEVEMRRALATEGELFLQYQPIVDIETEEMRGVEALVRWRHPTKGLLPPVEFIPLAESTGFIMPLGRWVLRESIRQATLWRNAIPAEAFTVSVNVSAQELLAEDFNLVVHAALAEHGLEPERLIVEVTESVLLNDMVTAHERLAALRAAGIKVALDDFGTGFSSLSYLHDLPVDILKVDRCFLAKRRSDGRHQEFLRAIYTLGRSLGMVTIAEGVEDLDDLELLAGFHVDRAQGYFFSRPVDADKLTSMITGRPMIAAGHRAAG